MYRGRPGPPHDCGHQDDYRVVVAEHQLGGSTLMVLTERGLEDHQQAAGYYGRPGGPPALDAVLAIDAVRALPGPCKSSLLKSARPDRR